MDIKQGAIESILIPAVDMYLSPHEIMELALQNMYEEEKEIFVEATISKIVEMREKMKAGKNDRTI